MEVLEVVVGGLDLRDFNIWLWLRGVDEVRELDSILNEKAGIPLPTISQLPSSVYNLKAKPRTSRTVSALPRDPRTVENRRKTGVVREVSVQTPALVTSSALS